MKRLLLAAFPLFVAVSGFSQGNTFIALYGGAGMVTANNYDVSPSIGISFDKGLNTQTGLGANLFYQTYSLFYDNEAHGATHGAGTAGVTDRNKTNYVFITPSITRGLGRKEHIQAYLDAGVGFNIGGFDSLRKFDHSYSTTGNPGNYDSSIDMSKNISKLLVRIGFGLKEYLYLGQHFRFTIIEDFGFLPTSLSKTTDADNPSRTQYFPHNLNPAMVSLQIGICYYHVHK